MEDKKELDKTQIGRHYGYKASPRVNTKDLPWYFSFIEKMGLPTFTTSKILMLAFFAVIMPLGVVFYIQGDWMKTKHLLLPLILILASLYGFLLMFALVNSYNGSILKAINILIRQMLKRFLSMVGNPDRDFENAAHKVYKDGTILTADGQVAEMFVVDGSTQATAYPSEIAKQEGLSKAFHYARNRTTTIVTITSSQKQNAETQIINNVNLQRANTNPAILASLKQDEIHIKENVNNRMPTTIQYQIYMDKKRSVLKDSINKMYRFEQRGYFNSVIKLDNREEVYRVLGGMLKLK